MKSQPNEQALAELSALFDGEAQGDPAGRLIKAATREQELLEAWRLYALIGDQLRENGSDAKEMTASVMGRIREEPVVLAPRRLELRPQHPFLALAASLAGVAVVGWLAMADGQPTLPQEARIAAVSPAPTFDQSAGVHAGARGDMSEYLLAHHTQAASFRLGDSTEHVRTVSMAVGASRP
jgi:sigma-E factor negative regulatory protein RseA